MAPPRDETPQAAGRSSSITGLGSVFPTFLCDKGILNVPIAPALAFRYRRSFWLVSLPVSGLNAPCVSFTAASDAGNRTRPTFGIGGIGGIARTLSVGPGMR